MFGTVFDCKRKQKTKRTTLFGRIQVVMRLFMYDNGTLKYFSDPYDRYIILRNLTVVCIHLHYSFSGLFIVSVLVCFILLANKACCCC